MSCYIQFYTPPKRYQVVALLGTGLCVGRRSSHVLASLRTPNVFIVSAPVITRCHFCIIALLSGVTSQTLLKENTTAVHLHKDMHSTVYFCVIIYADVYLKKKRNSKYNNVGNHCIMRMRYIIIVIDTDIYKVYRKKNIFRQRTVTDSNYRQNLV